MAVTARLPSSVLGHLKWLWPHNHCLGSCLETIIQGQFVQYFGHYSDAVTDKHLDGHSPLGFAMTAAKLCAVAVIGRLCERAKQSSQTSAWPQRRVACRGVCTDTYAKYSAITQIQHFQTASKHLILLFCQSCRTFLAESKTSLFIQRQV